jgi:hypothetical protein
MKPAKRSRNRRRVIEEIFFARSASVIPASIRLDLWYNHAKAHGGIPSAISGLGMEEVEDFLGFARAARYRAFPKIRFDSAEIRDYRENDEDITLYSFPEGDLVKRVRRSAAMIAEGISGHGVEYPLKSAADYELFLRHLTSASLTVPLEGFADFDGKTGEAGLPLLIVGSCPAHRVMLELAGYEAFYYHRADFPDLVDEVIAALDKLYRGALWPLLEKSPAKLILHGNHFSSAMTPPPLFDEYFLPYFRDFNDRMHGAGKKTLWHSDAEMRVLLSRVLEAGFDGADCLATHPLVPQSIDDYIRAWQGRIVLWGGLPSTIFDPGYPFADFKKYVEDLSSKVRGRNDFIFGASDNVMPGSEWRRLEFLAASLEG